MTSATERLRALLDERGVEWTKPKSALEYDETDWERGEWSFCAIEGADGELDLTAAYADWCSPEQAVAATLGPGTCEVEESWHGESEMVEYHCAACDEYMVVEVVKPDGAQPPNYCPSCGARVIGA